MLRSAALSLVLCATLASPALGEETLRGSRASMVRQNQVAKANDYSFLSSPAQVERFVQEGYLVPVNGTRTLEVDDGVSFPYARPELSLFLQRLAAQYHEGCGERLVVTSLTRPRSEQPRNSHPLSVHPAGMATDLRLSRKQACRAWLESALLSLEGRGILDVTRERHPPHYHVALFPDRYLAHVESMTVRSPARAEALTAALARVASPLRAEQTAPMLATAAPAPAEAATRSPFGPLAVVLVLTGSLALSLWRRWRGDHGA